MDHRGTRFYCGFMQFADVRYRFWGRDDFSDVKLRCGDRTYATSKFLLASKSEYFRRMFSVPFKVRLTMYARSQGTHIDPIEQENNEGMAVFEEDDPDQFERMMHFIYFGTYQLRELDPSGEMTGTYPYTLHQYQLAWGHLNMYTLADKFQCPLLAEYSLKYLRATLACLCDNCEWRFTTESDFSQWTTEHAERIVGLLYTILNRSYADGGEIRRMTAGIIFQMNEGPDIKEAQRQSHAGFVPR